MNAGNRGFDLEAHRELVASWRPSRYPSLDVFLPVCGEPLAVLHNTWTHVFELIRAYPGTATAYVLDDGADERVRVMAEDFGFTYMVRPDRGWMKKAGNLRYGFGCSSGEFILILDADFAPRADLPAADAPVLRRRPVAGHRPVPAVLPHPRTDVMDGARRRRGAGTVLPARAGVQGPARRRDLRGLLRDLPPRGAGGERRHHADRAFRGRAHRVRPAPGWLGAALPPDPAGGRAVPVRPRLLSRPAVPVVRGVDVAARIAEVLGHPDAPGGPAAVTCPASATTCTPPCSRSPPRRSRW